LRQRIDANSTARRIEVGSITSPRLAANVKAPSHCPGIVVQMAGKVARWLLPDLLPDHCPTCCPT
jgi:hypothetical protein